MTNLISILRACLFLIEVLTYNPPKTIRENQPDIDKDIDTDEPLFL